jgi:hypothetical protein
MHKETIIIIIIIIINSLVMADEQRGLYPMVHICRVEDLNLHGNCTPIENVINSCPSGF